MFNGEFTVWYDDQLNDVVDKISSALSEFGLTIESTDDGDGFVKYQIIQIKRENISEEEQL